MLVLLMKIIIFKCLFAKAAPDVEDEDMVQESEFT